MVCCFACTRPPALSPPLALERERFCGARWHPACFSLVLSGRWSVGDSMLVEIGHFALVLALLVAAVQGVMPLVGASARSRPLMDLAPPAALLQFGLVALAFATFMHAHIVSDFSVRNVFENSHTAKPMLYKVTGVWGSHEGSMMLWILMLTLFGGLVAAFGRALPTALRARTLSIQ